MNNLWEQLCVHICMVFLFGANLQFYERLCHCSTAQLPMFVTCLKNCQGQALLILKQMEQTNNDYVKL